MWSFIVGGDPRARFYHDVCLLLSVQLPEQMLKKLTAPELAAEDWGAILDLCHEVNMDSEKGQLAALKELGVRLEDKKQPRRIKYALSVLDALFINCPHLRKTLVEGKFAARVRKIMEMEGTLGIAAKEMVTRWQEEVKKKEKERKGKETTEKAEKDEDLDRAITLSLQQHHNNTLTSKPSMSTVHVSKPSLYPSFDTNCLSSMEELKGNEEMWARAVEDFEAADFTELSLKKEDRVWVIDHSNPQWWLGRVGERVGIFPAPFVIRDNNYVDEKKSKRQELDEEFIHSCETLLQGGREAEIDSQRLALQSRIVDERLHSADLRHDALTEIDLLIRDTLGLADSVLQREIHDGAPLAL